LSGFFTSFGAVRSAPWVDAYMLFHPETWPHSHACYLAAPHKAAGVGGGSCGAKYSFTHPSGRPPHLRLTIGVLAVRAVFHPVPVSRSRAGAFSHIIARAQPCCRPIAQWKAQAHADTPAAAALGSSRHVTSPRCRCSVPRRLQYNCGAPECTLTPPARSPGTSSRRHGCG
jgi:hypothetical protein